MNVGISISVSGGSPATAFAAGTLPSLAAWYKADAGITLNGATVSAWADQSGVGDSNRNLSQGTAGFQPTFVASDSNLGNRPSLLFTAASSTRLVSGAWSSAPAQPLTMYMAMRGGSQSNQYITDGKAGRGLIQMIDAGGKAAFYAGSTVSSTISLISTSAILCGVFNGASSSGYVSHYSNSDASGNFGTNTFDGITVGCGFNAANFFGGNIAEILVYGAAHSAAQRQTVVQYLGTKYGVSVSA